MTNPRRCCADHQAHRLTYLGTIVDASCRCLLLSVTDTATIAISMEEDVDDLLGDLDRSPLPGCAAAPRGDKGAQASGCICPWQSLPAAGGLGGSKYLKDTSLLALQGGAVPAALFTPCRQVPLVQQHPSATLSQQPSGGCQVQVQAHPLYHQPQLLRQDDTASAVKAFAEMAAALCGEGARPSRPRS